MQQAIGSGLEPEHRESLQWALLAELRRSLLSTAERLGRLHEQRHLTDGTASAEARLAVRALRDDLDALDAFARE